MEDIMNYLKRYGFAMYLGAISAIVGIYFPSWEYFTLNIVTITVVELFYTPNYKIQKTN